MSQPPLTRFPRRNRCMKILQVLFSGLGGQSAVVFSMVRGAASSTHSHVLIFFGIEDIAPGYVNACAELGVRYHVVKKRRGVDLRAWRDVIRILRREAPDAILLHSMSLILVAGVYRLRRPRVRLVAVEHIPLPVKRRIDWGFSVMALRMADAVVYLTDAYAETVRTQLGRVFRGGHTCVIGNGIDTLAFAPADAPPRSSPSLRVGMVARFSASKDHATLIRAAARLRDQDRDGDPGAAIQLVLVGHGDTFGAMSALAVELDLGPDRCEFLGLRPEHDLPSILRSLDVYVQSSEGEVMSTAVMQAMAVGLPVLASDVPGLHDMVRAGETGVLFRCGDVSTLASLIDRLRRAPDERARLGRAAREHARLHWSHETMFRSYELLLRRLGATDEA